MPDTLTPPTTAPAAPVTPTPAATVPSAPTAPIATPAPAVKTPAPSIAEAGKTLLAAERWDDVSTPTATPEPAVAEAATAGPTTDEPTDTPEPFAGFTLDAQNRLHRPDGTFADASEIAAYNADLPADPTTPTDASATPDGAAPEGTELPDTPQLHTVELTGRDGKQITVEVSDPELADALRSNAKDGMRLADYRQKVASVEAKAAEFKAFERLMETNPEHVVLKLLPESRRVSIATALLAQYWDQLAPTLVAFDSEPAQRIRSAAEAELAVRDNFATFERETQAHQTAVTLAEAVTALIPETMPEQQQALLLADAEHDLTRAMQAGQPVTPATIPHLLAPRLALYGLTPGATGTTSPTTSSPTAVVRAVGRPTAPTGTPAALAPHGAKAASLADVEAQQARLKQTQGARRRAAAVPPSGAGAAPTRAPAIPPGASIKDASNWLKKQPSW